MLSYKEAGEGVPLVLLHAYPLSSGMWSSEITYFSRTARVVAPDLPGFGNSPRQDAPSIPGMARAVGDLLESLSIPGPVILCGLSMGGYIAFEFVRQFPGRVKALGLFSTRAAKDAPESRKARLASARKIREEGMDGVPDVFMPKALGASTRSSKTFVSKQVSKMILENKKEGVADALLAMADRRDSTELLASIRQPTLVVGGAQDDFIPVEESRGMQAGIPDSRLEVIEEAGHLVNLEQPDKFRQTLEQFLKDVTQ